MLASRRGGGSVAPRMSVAEVWPASATSLHPVQTKQKLIVVYDNFVPGDPGSWFEVLYAFVVIPTSSPTLRVESQQALAFQITNKVTE